MYESPPIFTTSFINIYSLIDYTENVRAELKQFEKHFICGKIATRNERTIFFLNSVCAHGVFSAAGFDLLCVEFLFLNCLWESSDLCRKYGETEEI